MMTMRRPKAVMARGPMRPMKAIRRPAAVMSGQILGAGVAV
jgi:hypothetical protein